MTDGTGTYSEWFDDGRLACKARCWPECGTGSEWWPDDDTVLQDRTYENEALGGRAEAWTEDP